MATKLEKNISRESTVVVDDREIMVTLTADQKISMKLKGMRSGDVNISIEDLYNQLTGRSSEEESESKPKDGMVVHTNKPKKKGNDPMISLYDLRTYSAISGLPYEDLVKFEGIIRDLITNYKEKYGRYSKNDKLK